MQSQTEGNSSKSSNLFLTKIEIIKYTNPIIRSSLFFFVCVNIRGKKHDGLLGS